MGEKQTKPFQLGFNGFLKVAFQGSRVTSDGGLILVRELDEHLGMSQLIAQRHRRTAIKLYNFGYPIGIDSKTQLWPQDLPAGGSE